FLLTGKPVFESATIVELCQKHVAEPPVPPSERIGKPIPPELENAILACLDKSRAKRPQTARDLSLLVARCAEATQWSIEEADAWWGRHERGMATGQLSSSPSISLSGSPTSADGHDVTIDLTVKRR